mmetsp:Transcript_45116/g.109799  ORF Transcript_45116/g.109799 Transcript_45116/m.109799 type:complete len:198 (-) Transcript_45116:2531-3124(-)
MLTILTCQPHWCFVVVTGTEQESIIVVVFRTPLFQVDSKMKLNTVFPVVRTKKNLTWTVGEVFYIFRPSSFCLDNKPAEWASFETYRTEHPKEELGKSFEKTFNGDVDGIRSKNEVLADLQVNQQTQTDHQPGTTDSDKGNQIINVIDNGTPPRGGNETENHTGSEGRNPKRAGNGKSNKGSKKGKTAQGQAKDSDE